MGSREIGVIGDAARENALRRLRVNDMPHGALRDPVAMVQSALELPIAQLGFLEDGYVRYAASVGLAIRELPRECAPCVPAVVRDAALVVADATREITMMEHGWVKGEPGIRCFAAIPVHAPSGEAIGALSVMDFVPRTLTVRELSILESAARYVNHVLEMRELQLSRDATLAELARARAEAMRDTLTQAWTRDATLELLGRARARCARRKEPLTVARITLEQPEDLIRRCGRLAADAMLAAATQRVRTALRAYDLVGRWDEHELLAVICDAEAGASKAAVTRVARVIAEEPVALAGGVREISMRVGAAFCDFRNHAFSAAAMCAHAGHALEEARKDGEVLGWREL